MSTDTETSVVDKEFIAIRHKLLDVSAFLDRVDRKGHAEDFRVQSLKTALSILQESQPDRTRKILEHFSDLSTEPIDQAPGKGACGAVPPGEST